MSFERIVNKKALNGVREYNEGFPVVLGYLKENERPIIIGLNQSGYENVKIDLLDLLQALQLNEPTLIERIYQNWRISIIDEYKKQI